jgi:GNAT superfamily N-acetyltransferase
MVDCSFELFTDKNIKPDELLDLLVSVGWGKESDYDFDVLARSIAAYPVIVYCREKNGWLVGYVSAFTDNAFSTFIGELIVRPEFQRKGIGSSLLTYVVEQCKGVPVYATPFEDTQEFFLERGFKVPKRFMSVVSMRNAA